MGVAYTSVGDYAFPWRSAIFTTVTRLNPMFLVLPLAAALPYALPFWRLVQDRFLGSARTRASTTKIILSHALASTCVTGFVFFVAALLPIVPMLWARVDIDPTSAGLPTDGTAAPTEVTSTTFGALTQLGPWGLPVGYALWVATFAAAYALISLCLCLVQTSRVVALIVPWLLASAASVAMAWAGLEQMSPGVVMPFNLIPTPWPSLLVGVAGPVLVAASLLAWTLRHRETLPGLQ